MSTFIYSPGLEVLIDTLGNGVIDITEDIIDGSVTLTENLPSTLQVTFLNHRRKYDGVFTPNDIIVLKLKRLNWMQIFSGYLDEVPYFSTYPKAVSLKATCTLKRLKMSVWDSGSAESTNLLSTASGGGAFDQVDGGLRDKLLAVMEKVAGWPRYQVHIGQIPSDFSDRLSPLREKLADQLNVNPGYLGESGVVNGENSTTQGTLQVEGIGPGTGTLPSNRGKAGIIPLASLGEFTIQMRWPYQSDTSESAVSADSFLDLVDKNLAKNWWKGRKILVVNPTNDRAVVLEAVDWGPVASTGNVASLSSSAMESLGLGTTGGKVLEYRFASETAIVGPQPVKTVEQNTPSETKQYNEILSNEDGQVWTGWNGLQPYAQAARRFIKANWNIYGDIGGAVVRKIAGTNTWSDHSFGRAIDIMVSEPGSKAQGLTLAMGNAIAQFFVANPDIFGIKYVIWNDRKNSGNGWRPYGHPGGYSDNTSQHRDHVHVSFLSGARTEAGPMGNPWPGAADNYFDNYILKGNGASINQGGPDGSNLTGLVGPDGVHISNAFDWSPTPNTESEQLWGARALMNDEPIFPFVKMLCAASQRSFMSAPNGDFIAWFPDYFGHYEMASKLIVRDIELAGQGFTVAWDDSRLVTHQYVAGSNTGSILGPGQAPVTWQNRLTTMGIATVEFAELMGALFNVGADSSKERKKFFVNADAIFQRFGARVNYQSIPSLSGPEAEFWYAVRLLQKSWASQFSSRVDLSFMPEAYPGMLLTVESLKFQAYIESVTHTWDMADGQGFKTSVRVIAPSTTDASGFYALPLAGGAEDAPPPLSFPDEGGGVHEFL